MTSGRWALDRNITGTAARPGCCLIRWQVSTPFSPSRFQSHTIRSGGQAPAAATASSAVVQQRQPRCACFQYATDLLQNLLLAVNHQHQGPLFSKIRRHVVNLGVRLIGLHPISYFDRQEPAIDKSFPESRSRDNRYRRQGQVGGARGGRRRLSVKGFPSCRSLPDNLLRPLPSCAAWTQRRNGGGATSLRNAAKRPSLLPASAVAGRFFSSLISHPSSFTLLSRPFTLAR